LAQVAGRPAGPAFVYRVYECCSLSLWAGTDFVSYGGRFSGAKCFADGRDLAFIACFTNTH
jgi:hypothetical protein